MYHIFLAIAAVAAVVTPASAQTVTQLSPSSAAQNQYWETVANGLRHRTSGVECPSTLRTDNLPLSEIHLYRPDGKDVACHYREGQEGILSIFITHKGRYSFDMIVESANASVSQGKGLIRLEPGSGQCDDVLDKIIEREPRATREIAPSYCALYGSNSVHSAIALALAGNWAVKIRYTRSGPPEAQKMMALVTGAIDTLRDARRTHFEATP